MDYKFTEYFEKEVIRKRPYLTKELCIRVVENALHTALQSNERVRFWAPMEEFGGRVLRVVTLADKKTIHNAFLDRGYKR